MTSIFDDPPKTKAFSNQNKGHLGSRYIYIYTGPKKSKTYPGNSLTGNPGERGTHKFFCTQTAFRTSSRPMDDDSNDAPLKQPLMLT